MRAGFAAVLIFFGLTLAYVVWHLWRITPGGWIPKLTVSLTFVFWMGLAFATMGLRNKVSVPVITIIYEVGHPWLITFLYLLLAFVLADLAHSEERSRRKRNHYGSCPRDRRYSHDCRCRPL